MKKRIVLCADDYGQAPAISQGILALVKQGRLSAVSCLATHPFWLEHASWLKPYQAEVDVGLHWNLTEGKPLSQAFHKAYGEQLFTLPTLMRQAFLRKLNQSVLEAECHAQLDSFESAFGCLPRFIDGHQHVHQFPVIRAALVNVYQQRLQAQGAYVRLVAIKIKPSDLLNNYKKIIIYTMGTRGLQSLLTQRGIPHNHSFSGIYPFPQARHYPALFPQFLKEVHEGGLIMCHPGFNSVDADDAIAKARVAEYQYFASDQFLDDCAAQNVAVARFN